MGGTGSAGADTVRPVQGGAGGAGGAPDPPGPDGPRGVGPAVPRRVPEGTVPLVAFEGDAYDCGRAYGELVRERYPGYDTYLARAPGWRTLSPTVRRLYEQRAPYVPELFRGLDESARGLDGARAPGGGGRAR